MRGCKFTQPEPGYLGYPGLLFVHAIFATTPFCTGNFVAEDNVCVYGSYQTWPDDEQLLACLMSSFTSISIAGNDVSGHDDGVEVIFNGLYDEGDPAFHPLIAIKNNKVNLTQVLGEKWQGHGGILCFKNPKSIIEIDGNEVNASGPGVAFALTGDNVTFRNNKSRQAPLDISDLNSYPLAALVLGYNVTPPGFPTDLGASLNDSVISNNNISGTSLFGVWTYDANPNPYEPVLPLNTSHGNIGLGNNMDNLASLVATLFLNVGTHDNVFKGGFGSVIDMGTNNLVTGFTPKTGGIDSEVSEAIRRFSEGMTARFGMLAAPKLK